MGESTFYVLENKHIVDGVPTTEHKKEYRAWVREMQAHTNDAHRGCLHFDGEKLYFNANDDDFLYDDKKVYRIDNKSSLHHK